MNMDNNLYEEFKLIANMPPPSELREIMEADMRPITIRVDHSDLAWIDALAELSENSRQTVVSKFLLQGLRDATAGYAGSSKKNSDILTKHMKKHYDQLTKGDKK